MEVFSVPRITATAKRMSMRADHAFDLKLGCDLRSQAAQRTVIETIHIKET